MSDVVSLRIDAGICVGIGQCEMLEPEVFAVDDDGVATVTGAGSLPRDRALAVVARCPSGAISIVGPDS